MIHWINAFFWVLAISARRYTLREFPPLVRGTVDPTITEVLFNEYLPEVARSLTYISARLLAVPKVFTKQPAGWRLFVEAIVEYRPVSPNFYDGLKVQEVIDAAIESDKNGCWVSLR